MCLCLHKTSFNQRAETRTTSLVAMKEYFKNEEINRRHRINITEYQTLFNIKHCSRKNVNLDCSSKWGTLKGLCIRKKSFRLKNYKFNT